MKGRFIHISNFSKDAKTGKFCSFFSEDIQTLYQSFRYGAYESNNGPCLGWRESLTTAYQVRLSLIIKFPFNVHQLKLKKEQISK